jgi:hypothetical protein
MIDGDYIKKEILRKLDEKIRSSSPTFSDDWEGIAYVEGLTDARRIVEGTE